MSEQVSNDESALTETEREALWESINFWDDEADNLFPAVERILADRLAALRAEAHEAGYWVGYSEGKDEAETRDLNFDTLTSERDDLRARLAAVEALADEAMRRPIAGYVSAPALRAAVANPTVARLVPCERCSECQRGQSCTAPAPDRERA